MGATYVDVDYQDDKLNLIRSKFSSNYELPEYVKNRKIELLESKAALLFLEKGNKQVVSEEMIISDNKSLEIYKKKKAEKYNSSSKTIVPTMDWAIKVFPDIEKDKALIQLWDVIFDICKLNEDNPELAWENQIKSLDKRKNYLNTKKYKSLHLFDGRTDLTVELLPDSCWVGGYELNKQGIASMPNFPTEELFNAPSKFKVNGIVYNSKPLVYNNQTIDDFYFKIKDGYIYEYNARINNNLLDKIFEDENMRYFGEIALLKANTEIDKHKILFLNTLLDENCASHMALGRALKCNITHSFDDYQDQGLNYAINHIDFMFGTSKLNVIAYDEEHRQDSLIIGGKWQI
jgi:aminopeptidase